MCAERGEMSAAWADYRADGALAIANRITLEQLAGLTCRCCLEPRR